MENDILKFNEFNNDEDINFLLTRYIQIRKTMEEAHPDRDTLKDLDGIRRSIHNKTADLIITKKLAKDREDGRNFVIRLYYEYKDNVPLPEIGIFYEQELFRRLT